MKRFINWLKNLFTKTTEEKPQEKPTESIPSKPTDSRSILCGVVIGHTKTDEGAESVWGVQEYKYNNELFDNYLTRRYEGVSFVKILRDDIGISGAYAKAKELNCDCVIELHFNSYNGKVTGTETLCSGKPEDIKFATLIQKHVCNAFKRDGLSRGIKINPERGGQSCNSFDGPNCLIEPFFGDNKEEWRLAMDADCRADYAQAIVDAVKEYFK